MNKFLAIFTLIISFCFLGSAETKGCVYSQTLEGQCEALPHCSFYFMETQEIWKDIQGFEGLYQVSNTGKVQRSPSFIHRKKGKPYYHKGGKISPAIGLTGYCMVGLHKDGVHKYVLVHRLVAGAFILNEENKPQVNHKNSIKKDNSVNNLEWATAKENINHSFEKGTHFRGEKANNATITESKAIEIKKRHLETKYGAHKLKKHFFPELKLCLIQGIISGETWKHIKLE